jgi:O-acetyl-ADP-ribose deacetylase (regulator of RNase III)
MIKEYIKGSILDAPQKYIAHGVNAQNTMGSGVARVLFEKYPKVKKDYHFYHKDMLEYLDANDDLLGSYSVSDQDDGKGILNCYTQLYYGRSGKKYVSYDAIFDVFKVMIAMGVDEVAIPKIGCGLAGGNWEIVKQIIDDATGDDLDVYVYYLED